MPSKYRRSNCRICGASGNDVHISRTGLCPSCGEERHRTTAAEIRSGSGPGFERWVYGMLHSVAPNGRPPTPHDPDA